MHQSDDISKDLQLVLNADPVTVTHTVSQVSEWLCGQGVDASTAEELELVMAEALNNVVEHAYGFRNSGEIRLSVVITDQHIVVNIIDKGARFDGPPAPFDHDLANVSMFDLPEGGFGWNLIHTLTDAVDFDHLQNENRLKLLRRLA